MKSLKHSAGVFLNLDIVKIQSKSITPGADQVLYFEVCQDSPPECPKTINFTIERLEQFPSWKALFQEIFRQIEDALQCAPSFDRWAFEYAFRKQFPILALCWDAERCIAEINSIESHSDDGNGNLLDCVQRVNIATVALRYMLSINPEIKLFGGQLAEKNDGYNTVIPDRLQEIMLSFGDLPELFEGETG